MLNEETINQLREQAKRVAAQSPCTKRQVGCVLVDEVSMLAVTGYNSRPDGQPCDDANGKVDEYVIHAEDAAARQWREEMVLLSKQCKPTHAFVTHAPCTNCTRILQELNTAIEIVVVDDFLKFDKGKPDYSLVPPVMEEGLAYTLTYGMRKYKKGNWKKCSDWDKYYSAARRHLADFHRGIKYDEESGLHTLAMAMTNIGMLLWNEEQNGRPVRKADADKIAEDKKNVDNTKK